MAQINFPEATSNGQTFLGPNNVNYTYVGTPPNGYWSGTFQDQSFDTLNSYYLRLDASNSPITGDLTINADLTVTGDITCDGTITPADVGVRTQVDDPDAYETVIVRDINNHPVQEQKYIGTIENLSSVIADLRSRVCALECD